MKKILVLSDLHIPTRINDFPVDSINKYIDKVDIIFGLGDYDTQKGLNYLYAFNKTVYAVAGNMDDSIVKMNLPTVINIELEGFKIGLTHGWGSPSGIRERIARQFESVNLICYGHTHTPYFNKDGNIYFFNPGSLYSNNPSFGILNLEDKKINAEIINF